MADALPGILSPKIDFVFKRIFGDANHPAPLSAFLQAARRMNWRGFRSLTRT